MKIKLILLILFFTQFLNASNSLKKVTLQLSWFNQFQFAGYYIAKEKGFYKELGLDVEIKPFKFGVNIPQEVSNKKIDFAVGRETLILEKKQNKNIIVLFALFQSSPLVLLSKKDSNINKISDFKNKKIMTTIDDASEVSIKSMITSSKINLNTLKFLKHTHNINNLINNDTDVISAYISKSPFDLQDMGIDYNIFAPKDYGFDMYSDLLYTNQELIDKDSTTVNNFKYASLKGWEYAYSHIEESVNLILKKYNSQNISKEALIYEAKELKKLSYLNNERLGNIDLNKLQRIHDLYNIMGLLSERIDLDKFVYNTKMFYTQLTKEEREFIKNNPIISIGQKEDLKPLNFLDNIEVHQGIFHDIINIVSEKTGLRFIHNINTRENLINKLELKEIDIISMPLTLENNNFIETASYFKLTQSVFKRTGPSTVINKIGVFDYIIDTSKVYKIKEAYPRAEIINLITIEESIKNLLNGNIDILHIPKELLLSYIKDNNINNIEIASSKIITNKVPIGLVLNSESKILHSILTKAIKDISFEQKESINNKWIPIILKKEFDWSIIWQLFTFLAVVIIGLLYKIIKQQNSEQERLSKQVRIKTRYLQLALDEKELLLKELNHRVKNNMQTIVSLIKLQSYKIKDEKINDIFNTIENRINAMSHLHELLYQQESITQVNANEYFELVINELQASFNKNIIISYDIQSNLELEQAVYCGSILNELVTNAFKYAFVEEEGTITISLFKNNGKYCLVIKDDGIGYDINKQRDSLGLVLVKELVQKQLHGDMQVDTTNGVEVKVVWENSKTS